MARKKNKKPAEKTDLQKKLSSIRTQMRGNDELISKWRNWAKGKRPDITDIVFRAMTRGERIAKGNILFAIDLANEGTRLANAYEKQVNEAIQKIKA